MSKPNIKNFFNESNLTYIFCLLAIIQFAVLFYYSVGFTGISDINTEYITIHYDSIIANTFLTAIAILGLYAIKKSVFLCGKFKNSKNIKVNMDMIAVIVSIIVIIIGIYWVNASATAPFADSEEICNQASKFNNGDFSDTAKGKYMGFTPHQLGIVTFIRILFKIFGDGNYKTFQYFNAILSGLLCFSSYKVTKILSSDSSLAEALILLLTVCCAPLFLYVPFIYGEIPSTTLLMVTALLLMRYDEKPRVWQIITAAVLCGLSLQFRLNSWIIVIGFLIALIVRFLTKKSKWIPIMIISILAGIFCFNGIVKVIYNDKYPEDSHPIPSILWVAMGLMNDEEPGWFNGYNYNAFIAQDYDPEKASAMGKEYIVRRIPEFLEANDTARDFFSKKLIQQWEAPLFQAIFMNRTVVGEQTKLAQSVYDGQWHYRLYRYMNIYQLLIYGSILFLLISRRKKWKEITAYNILIGIFGGFIFTLLWEAKTRYVLPYFLLMLPYAAVGLDDILNKITYYINNRRKENLK